MRQPVDKLLPFVSKIAILGNYPPRRCGIATFTADLTSALNSSPSRPHVDVIAMSDVADHTYPEIVLREIAQQDLTSYRRVGAFLNEQEYDVLSVQHEYGIFGGETGRYLLTLLREVKIPVVTTLHTVLRDPSPSQRAVLAEIVDLSARVIVMSQRAVAILVKEYGIRPEKIDTIPHGIPDFSPKSGKVLRELLGIRGPMILTFGLLSPGKGIEYVIQAMPAIAERIPGATYVILGATHPHVIASSGEAYRTGLQAMAHSLGVSDNVRFVNEFVTTEELTAYLGAADIYVSPYVDRDQITSGTLAYAVGAGKCVISTPYPYAEELLANGRGIMVPFSDSSSIAEAVLIIEENPEDSRQMAKLAASHGKTMRWQEVALRTMASLSLAVQETSIDEPKKVRATVPTLNLEHLLALSNDTGIYQHASLTIPNRSEGYCVDDNCRALILSAYLAEDRPLTRELARAQGVYLGFVAHALNPENGRFRNFMSFGHQWLEDAGSEDSHGRALWSLGTMIGRCPNEGYRKLSLWVFHEGCEAVTNMTSPRTWAYSILAALEVLRAYPENAAALKMRDACAAKLLHIYKLSSTERWKWFEGYLTYANARLSQALLLAGKSCGNKQMMESGIESLTWLAKRQVSDAGVFAPIGTQRYFTEQRAQTPDSPAMFDQQPIEAWVSVSAYLSAATVTSDPSWLWEADRAYRWFLGDNMLGLPLYDAMSGGCRDGLHQDRPNENQGAESTLSFLCASLEMRQTTPATVSSNAMAL